MKKVFTTGQVAKICKVAPRTVSKWFDSGRLRGYRIRELLPEDDDFKYELASSGFEAGIQAESFHPDTIIIDLAMGRTEARQIATNLRRKPEYEQTLIIALA